MDYISRLVGSASPSPTRQPAQILAQQRLISFKKVHDQLQQIWRKNSSSKQPLPAEAVQRCLVSMRRILQDEGQTPAPHLCARHVSTFQIYTTLVQVASIYYDELIIHGALDIFEDLIDSEQVEFLEESGFADALIGFVGKVSTTGPLMVSIDTEARIVEVLFAIASKIRLQPQLLVTWFRPLRSPPQVAANTLERAGSEFNTRTEQEVFPLFYLILDYVHGEGRVGDFARTGLLYLIETAAHSEALEKWIVEGDLATLMASGLGALYSQLSRKLVLSTAKDSVSPIISFSETAPAKIPPDAEETDSPEFQAHLATFLSYLAFWQDILEHCSCNDVKQSLLDHFRLLFLQQLLYPSLIESSDTDGGSSVAVLTYLRCIVESINNVDLLQVTLQYLLALPEKREEETAPVRPTTLARRRKSSMLVTNLAQGQEKPMPDLFTLVDFILSSLRSCNQQTVTATLQLISVILSSHHGYATLSLVKAQPLDHSHPTRTIDAHTRDTEILFSIAEDLIEHDDVAESYEAHLQDARTLLESHSCSSRLLALPGTAVGSPRGQLQKTNQPGIVQPHQLTADDPFLGSLLCLLGDFLTNDIGTNLRLTQTFSTLASCGKTRLEGWLLGDPVNDENYIDHSVASGDASDHDDTITLDNAKSHTVKTTSATEFQEPRPTDTTAFPVFATLDNLVNQVERFRHNIEEFDLHLAERRHVFKVGEDIDKAVANDLPAIPKPEERNAGGKPRESKSRSRTSGQIGSISERLMSETPSSNASRSSSPRGRQPSDSTVTPLVGRLNNLRISPSPSPSPSSSAPRTFLPSPLREGSAISTPAKQTAASTGPVDVLRQRIKIKTSSSGGIVHGRDISSETSSIRSVSITAESKKVEPEIREVLLSHLLTNVIILQEFILELAAIIEVRASLFGEVRFV